MFQTYSIFDAQDPDKPVKTRLASQLIDMDTGINEYMLTMHNLELSYNIYSPFKS